MKPQLLPISFCALLLSLLGCENKQTAPVTSGPFTVNSDTGIATGQVLGIDLKAAGADGAKVKSDLSGAPQSPSQAHITLADDLKLKLQTIDEGKSISLELNGKPFGNLAKGDKLEIAKDRSVTVNGKNRTPAENPAK